MVELYFEACPVAPFLDAAKRELFVSRLPLERAARIRSTRKPELAAQRAAAEKALGRAAKRAGEESLSLRMKYTDEGKPMIVDRPDLAVSFSHSGGMACAILAKTPDQTPLSVGVDIEQMKELPSERLLLAERFFAPPLLAEWKEAAAEARTETFYRLWTRMEATVKMTGEGMRACRSESHLPTPDRIREWRLSDEEGGRYIACAVYEQTDEPGM
jgi:phosphopantetheine--protein transferase-like protein